MKLLYILSFVIFNAFLPTQANQVANIDNYNNSPPPPSCCLTDKDARHVLRNWVKIFTSSFEPKEELYAQINKTIAPNFVDYEETYNGGTSPIAFTGRDGLYAAVTATNGGPPAVTDLKFNTLYTFHSCRSIAFRWQATAKTTGFGITEAPGVVIPLNTTLVKPGTAYQYKGIDLLEVDCHTKLITKAYTSQDSGNFLTSIGYIFCPAT